MANFNSFQTGSFSTRLDGVSAARILALVCSKLGKDLRPRVWKTLVKNQLRSIFCTLWTILALLDIPVAQWAKILPQNVFIHCAAKKQ